MFLDTLIQTNSALLDAAFQLHGAGEIQPDTFLLDVDVVLENARIIKQAGDKAGVELFFMSKQMGRNPLLCRELVKLGYPGAVVVDWREAQVMMDANIPIAHAGHLVQIPNKFLPTLLEYGVGMVTVFSLEKALAINEVAKQLGRVQALCLRVVEEDDYLYPGQEGGFTLAELPAVLKTLEALAYVSVEYITAFPCFLYDPERGEVEACHNLVTVQTAAKLAEQVLGKAIHLNLPSCTQTEIMERIAAEGGTSAEPGSALIGTLPNNTDASTPEKLAVAYVSEVSHHFQGKSQCFGGGIYPRGHVQHALVGKAAKQAVRLPAGERTPDNIDYYLPLEGEAPVGDCAVLAFRPQIFTSRSHVVLLQGVQTGRPEIIGRFDAQGKPL